MLHFIRRRLTTHHAPGRPTQLSLEPLDGSSGRRPRLAASPRCDQLEARIAPTDYPVTTEVISSDNPSDQWQTITLTARLTAHDPFGFTKSVPPGLLVEFYNGPTFLESSYTDNFSCAWITVNTLPVGANQIQTRFSGAFAFNGLSVDLYYPSDGSITQTVDPPAPPPPPPPNVPPVISDITNQTVQMAARPAAFVVTHAETAAELRRR